MARGRFFRYGELPLVLLALVDQEPRSGYELMAELDRLFGPSYRPSPGSVYPALKALAAEDLVVDCEVDGAATYEPTEAGRQVLRDRRDELAAVEHRTGRQVVSGDRIEQGLAHLRARVHAVAGRVSEESIIEELEATAARIEWAAAGRVKERGSA